jgi:hypothetical protein
MRLILSSRHPRNSVYTTETGQVLYKVDKPHKFGHGIATIRKAVGTVHGVWQGDGLGPKVLVPSLSVEKSPFDDPEPEVEEGRRDSMDSEDEDVPFADSDSDSDDVAERGSSVPSTSGVLEGHFAYLAQIEFHGISSTRFHYNNLDVSVDELFRKEGRSWYGRWVPLRICVGIFLNFCRCSGEGYGRPRMDKNIVGTSVFIASRSVYL